ncbi:hypothetical protein Tco_1365672 [Tanacetum coccineum]
MHHLEHFMTSRKTLSIRLAEDLSNMHLSFHHVFIFVDRVYSNNLLDRFPAQSIRSSNAGASDSLYLLVLVIGTSQSRHHGSYKSPTTMLVDVDTRRISICHYEMLKSTTLNVL